MKITPSNPKYQEYPSPSLFVEEQKFFIEEKNPFGFRFSENKENKIIETTNNLTNRIEEHKPEKRGVQKRNQLA